MGGGPGLANPGHSPFGAYSVIEAQREPLSLEDLGEGRKD